MKLEEILEMWKKDAVIDEMDLGNASRESAVLHGKYLEILTVSKLQLKQRELRLKVLLKDKFLYYNGKMDKQTIDDYGWKYDPFNGLKQPIKSEMDYWYDADEDIQNQLLKIETLKVKVNTLEDIIQSVKWRHQSIKNAIDWHKFTSGM